MAVHHLPTGTYETRAAFAVQGGSFRDKRPFAASAVLVRHPQGDLLIDAGFSARETARRAVLAGVAAVLVAVAGGWVLASSAAGYLRLRKENLA